MSILVPIECDTSESRCLGSTSGGRHMADDSGGGGTAANDTTAAAGMLADAPAQDEAVARAVRELVRHLAAAPRPPEPAGAQPRRPYRVKQVAAALDVRVAPLLTGGGLGGGEQVAVEAEE